MLSVVIIVWALWQANKYDYLIWGLLALAMVCAPLPAKYLRCKKRATLTRLMSAGTSTRGPMTAANACPDPMPNTATATAIASSKLKLAAVKAMVVVLD